PSRSSNKTAFDTKMKMVIYEEDDSADDARILVLCDTPKRQLIYVSRNQLQSSATGQQILAKHDRFKTQYHAFSRIMSDQGTLARAMRNIQMRLRSENIVLGKWLNETYMLIRTLLFPQPSRRPFADWP